MALTEDLAMFQRLILESARQKILFLPRAIRQMSRPDRMITVPDVRRVVTSGEIIENYPEDARGHSCLLVGADRQGRWIHVVCSPKSQFLAIITAYVPDPKEWDVTFRVRSQS